ncbi:cardiolipin synthase [Bacillus carboniphilus]|uniref:Cardiolipin synthase n=1 Tax=Bacillus carboniphilus TaxID=86663 RepID=A0ABY9JY55_9BACI|nr:cardiolipin synthase [Bacillus carboniphilus]WLR44314.1 cardiolipin synthase [Bacillus carboniphilus]
MDYFNGFFTFIFILNILLSLFVVFLERKSVTATWAWVLILNFIPLLGFILYLIFGQNLSRRKIFKWDQEVFPAIKEKLANQMAHLSENPSSYYYEEIIESKEIIYMHMNNSDAPLTLQNDVRIFTDGQEKFDQLFKDIEQAKDHIHLIYYIFRSDDLGTKLGDLLIKKAKQGVKVRLLYDASGSRAIGKKFLKRLNEAGILTEPFFPSKIPFFNYRINYRNHRKLVIIDGNIGYIGGFNVGDEYLGKDQHFGYWRDTHLRIVGGAVNDLQARYMLDWNQASKEQMVYKEYYHFNEEETKEGLGIQVVSSGPDSKWEQIKNGYIKMILTAKEYIYLQTPYFIPDESLLDALTIASLSGIDVRVMIPNKPDHPFVYWATYSHVGQLLKAGAKVYTYEKGFLHSKCIVVDGKVSSVGTANIDVRSFRLNFEVNAFIYDDEIAHNLTSIFHEDCLNSSILTYHQYQSRSLKIRFKESISRLLSPIL